MRPVISAIAIVAEDMNFFHIAGSYMMEGFRVHRAHVAAIHNTCISFSAFPSINQVSSVSKKQQEVFMNFAEE